MMPLTGQTEKIGHFRQPTARATGQRIMAAPLWIGANSFAIEVAEWYEGRE